MLVTKLPRPQASVQANMATTAAIIGSTGLVGSNILSTLLSSDAFSAVHTVSRRRPKSTAPKLAALIEADTTAWASKLGGIAPPPAIVFSALGTSRAEAGSLANQWKIDHNLNVELAKAARAAGTKTFVFISSVGTGSLLSRLLPYLRMKIGVEDGIKELGFEHAVIVRPGIILGERKVMKQGEPAARAVVDWTGWIFGQGAKDLLGQDADVIAKAAVHAALLVEQGKVPEKYWVLDQADIVRLGRTEWNG